MNNNRVDQLFNVPSHNPSYFSVKESAGFQGEIIDFCIPVNLHFPPPEMKALIHEHLEEILRYYPDYSAVHAKHIGEIIDLDPQTIVPCNGSTEIITRLCQETRGSILTSIPTFSRWTDLPDELGLTLHTIERKRHRNFRLDVAEIVTRVHEVDAKTLVVSNPNNPTGAWLTLDEIEELSFKLKDLDAVIVDESFIDFSDIASAARLATQSTSLVVVKSMGKSLGWHGVRLGYAVTNPERALRLQRILPFWNINGLAAYVLKTLTRFGKEYRESFERVAEDRIYMSEQVAAVPGLTVFPSKANFVFVELAHGVSGRLLRDRLLSDYGLMIRECSNKIGCSERFLRLAVQKRDAVDALVTALRFELGQAKTVSAA